MRELLDPEDGENRAVRAFLMHYGAPGLTVRQQRDNMRRAGWDGYWPAWVTDVDGHLTKGGAQDWLRYLFGLECNAGVAAVEAPRWPAGLLERVKAAEQRVHDNRAARSIPADPHSDVDLVLAEVRALIEGTWPPFWIKPAPGVSAVDGQTFPREAP